MDGTVSKADHKKPVFYVKNQTLLSNFKINILFVIGDTKQKLPETNINKKTVVQDNFCYLILAFCGTMFLFIYYERW